MSNPLDGPQWKQLPMLMTPDEVRDLGSVDYHGHKVDDTVDLINRDEPEKMAALDRAMRKTGKFKPVDVVHNDYLYPAANLVHRAPFLGNGHHRAGVAISRNWLIPVQHHETWDTVDVKSDRDKRWNE